MKELQDSFLPNQLLLTDGGEPVLTSRKIFSIKQALIECRMPGNGFNAFNHKLVTTNVKSIRMAVQSNNAYIFLWEVDLACEKGGIHVFSSQSK